VESFTSTAVLILALAFIVVVAPRCFESGADPALPAARAALAASQARRLAAREATRAWLLGARHVGGAAKHE
jgi:hypothetical protein